MLLENLYLKENNVDVSRLLFHRVHPSLPWEKGETENKKWLWELNFGGVEGGWGGGGGRLPLEGAKFLGSWETSELLCLQIFVAL